MSRTDATMHGFGRKVAAVFSVATPVGPAALPADRSADLHCSGALAALTLGVALP